MSNPSPEILRRFTFVPPTAETRPKYELLNKAFLEIAVLVDETTPEGREKALALTQLQDARMWANAAIATHQPK